MAWTDDIEASFDKALSAALQGLPGGMPRCLVSAVSGGPDSTALALLAHGFARRNALRHEVCVVNHAIREEAASEADRVVRRLLARGVHAFREDVTSPAPTAGLQEWARRKRYGILVARAARQGAALLLGHHADDQAETVAMRLERDSGLGGIGGMRGVASRRSVALVRPFLMMHDTPVDQQKLRRYCEARQIAFENDPSNLDERFERVRVRRALAELEGRGFAVKRGLVRLADAARCIDDGLIDALHGAGLLPAPLPSGHILLPRRALKLQGAVRTRLLGHAVRLVGNAEHPPGRAAMDALARRLVAGNGATLSGCQFTPDGAGWLVTAEPGRDPGRDAIQVEAGERVVFAGKWNVSSEMPGRVRYLGVRGSGARGGWRDSIGWKGLAPQVRRSLPVLETLDGSVVYPHLLGHDSSIGVDDASPATAEFIAYSRSARNQETVSPE